MADTAPADLHSAPHPEPPARPQLKTVPKAHPDPAPYAAGYEMLNDTLSKTQEMLRHTALQLCDNGLHSARRLIELQETLLGMAQTNMTASVAAAQRIVGTTTLEEALALHKRFAQDQASALTGQTAALRKLMTAATGETAEPWADYWTKSFAQIKKAFAPDG